MTQVWKSNPHFELVTAGAYTLTDDQAITIQVVRPENNISHATLMVNDYKSRNLGDYFDTFWQLDISLYYGNDTPTKVFSGMINKVSPNIDKTGETLEVTAWGWEWALLKTHCNTSYGTQGEQAAIGGHPEDIIRDIITNYVNRAFGATGLTTQWDLDPEDVDPVFDATAISYINCPYIDNFSAINRVCEITNAYAGSIPDPSCHWYVDTDKHFRFKQIYHSAVDGDWGAWWGGTSRTDPGDQTSSLLVVTEDMIQYDFRKNIDEYANKVVLAADLRVPGYDYWTEGNADTGLWGEDQGVPGNPHIELTNSATRIVGATSLRAEQTDGAGSFFWYPSTQDAAWDFTRIGSPNTVPRLNFYAMRTGNIESTIWLCHDADATRFHLTSAFDNVMSQPNVWYYFSFPIGPYHESVASPHDEISWWNNAGGGSWIDVDYIKVYLNAAVGVYLYLDDLHISGKVIREAKDTSEITATQKEHQKFLRCDNAVDDLFKSGTPLAGGGGGPYTDLGTAARIAHAELLRRARSPYVALIQIPMAEDILPGQLFHIHAGKKADGTYRINSSNATMGPFRAKEIRHNVSNQGFTTQLNLTNDVDNTFAFGVPNAYSLLIEQVQGMDHGQARDVKSSSVDVLVPRLSESY